MNSHQNFSRCASGTGRGLCSLGSTETLNSPQKRESARKHRNYRQKVAPFFCLWNRTKENKVTNFSGCFQVQNGASFLRVITVLYSELNSLQHLMIITCELPPQTYCFFTFWTFCIFFFFQAFTRFWNRISDIYLFIYLFIYFCSIILILNQCSQNNHIIAMLPKRRTLCWAKVNNSN